MKNLVTCLVVCVLSGAALADTWTVDDDGKAGYDNIQEAVGAPSDGETICNFGGSVSISGNTAIVSASRADDNGNTSGLAYILRFDGKQWIEEAKLTASDGASGDYFGSNVSISGNTAIVSASLDDNGGCCGLVYVYCFDGKQWIEETKLTASDDSFGRSISISGDTVIVGAPRYDEMTRFVDEESRFEKSLLEAERNLLNNGHTKQYIRRAHNDNYGDDVPIYGDSAHGYSSGAAYIYRYSGKNWVGTKLTASDGWAHDFFGCSVAISGNIAIVGAYGGDEKDVTHFWRVNLTTGTRTMFPGGGGGGGNTDDGAAYIYRFDGNQWIEESKLIPDTTGYGRALNDLFGGSVSISGNTAIVGASADMPYNELLNEEFVVGSVYIFRFDGKQWIKETKLTASDSSLADPFGGSVSISGNTVIVAAPNDSANVYHFDGVGWNEEAKLLATDGASSDNFGCSVSISGDTAIVGASRSAHTAKISNALP